MFTPHIHCVPPLVCPKTPCVCLFAVNSLFPSLKIPRVLLIALNPSCSLALRTLHIHSRNGLRVSDEGTRSLAIKCLRVWFPSNPLRSLTHFPKTPRVCLFAVKLLAFPLLQIPSADSSQPSAQGCCFIIIGCQVVSLVEAQGRSQPHVSPTFTDHRPKDSVRREFAALSPRGFHQSLDFLPTDAICAKVSACRGRGGKGQPRHGVLGLTVGLGGWLVWVA